VSVSCECYWMFAMWSPQTPFSWRMTLLHPGHPWPKQYDRCFKHVCVCDSSQEHNLWLPNWTILLTWLSVVDAEVADNVWEMKLNYTLRHYWRENEVQSISWNWNPRQNIWKWKEQKKIKKDGELQIEGECHKSSTQQNTKWMNLINNTYSRVKGSYLLLIGYCAL